MCSLNDIEHPEEYASMLANGPRYALGAAYRMRKPAYSLDQVDSYIDSMKSMYSKSY